MAYHFTGHLAPKKMLSPARTSAITDVSAVSRTATVSPAPAAGDELPT